MHLDPLFMELDAGIGPVQRACLYKMSSYAVILDGYLSISMATEHVIYCWSCSGIISSVSRGHSRGEHALVRGNSMFTYS